MLYLDTYFANLNVVVRIVDFLSCREDESLFDEKVEFEQNKFYYITSGTCTIQIEDKKYIGKAGSFFFIPAGTRHSYFNHTDAPFEKYWLHCDLYPNSSIFKLLNLSYCVHPEDDSVLQLFRELFQKYESKDLTDKLDVKSLAIKLLSSFISISRSGTKVPLANAEEQISRVLSYINQNLDRHITNAELSELCHQHPNHFVRFFKKKTGTTPQKYITERRVQMAKRLIEQTDLKFSDIAELVGFFDAPHLSKVFKQYYALSPQACRKRRDRQASTYLTSRP